MTPSLDIEDIRAAAERLRGEIIDTPCMPSRTLSALLGCEVFLKFENLQFTAYHLGCKAILALTESGSTALWMSRHRIHVPIYGLTSQVRSQRRMALYRNVSPMLMPNFSDRDQALAKAEALLIDSGVLKPGDTYAITCGEPMGHPGGTNMLKVCRVA